ncbi:hypothetical protein JJQ72_12440 [Paenibacillus sp. F411]|uniref:DUF7657 domain-containing protein n=1 Tax=Paenibacillus sp. F411 TaxID=2820239 RepID=UPI001AAFEB4B|nr:hypothetical protein [Paenibacillus sp. F411]MBO2944781.1 hypothetical protein [Paenibacillus sp. F411]
MNKFKSAGIKVFVFLISFLMCNVFLFGFFKPSIEIVLSTHTDSTPVIFFYDNKSVEGYPFDDSNMLSDKTLIGQGTHTITYKVPIEYLNKVRLDFGTVPASFEIYSMTIFTSPIKKSTLIGEDIINKFNHTNEISNYRVINGVVEFDTTGTDGHMYSLNLLSDLSSTPRGDVIFLEAILIAISLAVTFKKYTWWLISFTSTFIVGIQIRSWRIIKNGKSRLEKALGLFLVLVYSSLSAFVFDIIILRGVAIFSEKLNLDTLSRYFSAAKYMSLERFYFFFIFFFIIGLILFLGTRRAIRYRYGLAILLLVLLVLGRFTGSSLGFYDNMLQGNTSEYERSTLLGIPQGIRGDEWATEKPYYFAQIMGGTEMPYFNKNLSFNGNDMVVSAFAPVKDVVITARPDLWGFLFLPKDYAFSFYWVSRIILLFMASFEMAYLLTKRYRYAVLGAVAIIFAPPVQWWLSQALMLMLMSGQFAIVLLNKYLKSNKGYIQALSLIGVAFFALVYTLTMYPATQVPLAYIFLAVLIYVLMINKDSRPFAPKRILQYVIAMIPLAGIIIYFYKKSSPALHTIMNTIYPGSNRPWIPLPWDYELYQFVNVFTAIVRQPDFLNSSEISQFYTFSPFVILIVLLIAKKRSQEVVLPLLLFGASMLLWIVSWLPQMPVFNKLTLFSFTYPVRITYAIGFGFTLLIISLLPLLEKKFVSYTKKSASILSGVIGFLTLCIMTNSNNVFNYFKSFQIGTILMILSVMLLSFMGYLLLNGGKNRVRKFSIILAFLSVLTTCMVNPITQGLDSMFEKTAMVEIREIDREDNGRWMVSGSPTISNLVTAQGVARTTGTYYYPDWEMMTIIDKKHEYIDMWNQFAHIDMRLTEKKLEFSLLDHERSTKVNGTNRIIYIPIETVRELKIKYIFTMLPVPSTFLDNGDVQLVYKDEVDPWSIYRVNYQ